jgi:dihydrofolate reductase
VVSRQPKFAADNVIVTRTLTEAIELAGEAISTSPTSEPAEIMVIGGGQLYNEAISDADKLYLTRVDADPDGDTWFPEIDPARFELISREDIPPSEKDTASCQFEVYRRRASMGN